MYETRFFYVFLVKQAHLPIHSSKTKEFSPFFAFTGLSTLKKCSASAWIRNFCLDQDPELLFRIRIHKKIKDQIN